MHEYFILNTTEGHSRENSRIVSEIMHLLIFVFIDELYELWKDNFLRLLLIYCQLCISISVSKNETTDEDTCFINVVSLSAVTLW